MRVNVSVFVSVEENLDGMKLHNNPVITDPDEPNSRL